MSPHPVSTLSASREEKTEAVEGVGSETLRDTLLSCIDALIANQSKLDSISKFSITPRTSTPTAAASQSASDGPLHHSCCHQTHKECHNDHRREACTVSHVPDTVPQPRVEDFGNDKIYEYDAIWCKENVLVEERSGNGNLYLDHAEPTHTADLQEVEYRPWYDALGCKPLDGDGDPQDCKEKPTWDRQVEDIEKTVDWSVPLATRRKYLPLFTL